MVFSEICGGDDSQFKLFFRWSIYSEMQKRDNLCSRCLAYTMYQAAGEKGRQSCFVEIACLSPSKLCGSSWKLFLMPTFKGEGRHLLLLWLPHICSKLLCPKSDIPSQSMQVHLIYLLMLEEFWKPAKNNVVSDAFARTLLPDPSVSCRAE